MKKQTGEKKKLKFTDLDIKNLKTEKRLEDFIDRDGFGVRVFSTGAKVFFYRYTFDGKRRFLNLGHYDPKFEFTAKDGTTKKSLAYHRQKYIEAKNKVNQNIDPLFEKVTNKAKRLGMPTMSEFFSDYITKYAKINKKSWEQDDDYINRELLTKWGKTKVSDITKKNIKDLLDEIVARGTLVTANRVHSLIHKLFEFATEEGIIENNPCAKVKRPLTKEKPKTRYLSNGEIKTFWSALEKKDLMMSRETRTALKIILLTAQRPGEVIGMHENEIDGHWWTLPAERTKNKRIHRVYLTDTVLQLIGEYKNKGYIFPSPKGNNHATEGSLANALRRNIKGQSSLRDKAKRRKGKDYERGPYKTTPHKTQIQPDKPNRFEIEMVTPHDLRRTGSTLMSSLKVRNEHRKQVLNHAATKLDDTYNQYEYDDEKRAAMEILEKKILSIISMP